MYLDGLRNIHAMCKTQISCHLRILLCKRQINLLSCSEVSVLGTYQNNYKTIDEQYSLQFQQIYKSSYARSRLSFRLGKLYSSPPIYFIGNKPKCWFWTSSNNMYTKNAEDEETGEENSTRIKKTY